MGLARTQNKRQMGRRCAVYFKRMALHVRRAPTNIGHPQTLGIHIHKEHPQTSGISENPQGARTNIGHPQGTTSTRHLKSKDCTQSELGQQQFQVVGFWYFYVFSATEILNTQELSERKHSQCICPWFPRTISAPLC